MARHEPNETYDDGSAIWDADPFEVAAHPGEVNGPVVVLDGRSLTPRTALHLAEVLNAAAMWALRKNLPE